MHQIAKNAGHNATLVVDKLSEHTEVEVGFNAATGEYEDLMKAGIIDPVKVSKSALKNAASIATLLLTTEAIVVTDFPEDKS